LHEAERDRIGGKIITIGIVNVAWLCGHAAAAAGATITSTSRDEIRGQSGSRLASPSATGIR
jgi:hypothetical protein